MTKKLDPDLSAVSTDNCVTLLDKLINAIEASLTANNVQDFSREHYRDLLKYAYREAIDWKDRRIDMAKVEGLVSLSRR